MSLIRKHSLEQLQRIMKDIENQGGDISDTEYEEGNGWCDNPLKEKRFKIPTIDDHMTIDIPDVKTTLDITKEKPVKQKSVNDFSEFKKIKENNKMEIFNFDEYVMSEAFEIYSDAKNRKTIQNWVKPNKPITIENSSSTQIGLVGKPVVINGENGIITRLNSNNVVVEINGEHKEISFKDFLKNYKPGKPIKEDSSLVGLIPDDKSNSKIKEHEDVKEAKPKEDLTQKEDKKKPKKTNKKIFNKITHVKDNKDVNNIKVKPKNYKLKRFGDK